MQVRPLSRAVDPSRPYATNPTASKKLRARRAPINHGDALFERASRRRLRIHGAHEIMMEEHRLIEKLRRIEALFAGTTFEGERNAAADAMRRIRSRLREARKTDAPVEYTFTLPDIWSRKLLVALLRRYEIRPYRYRGQRHTTVMAHVPVSFVDQTLWPEFCQLSDTLRSYLDEVTDRVISSGIHRDASEATVRERPALSQGATEQTV